MGIPVPRISAKIELPLPSVAVKVAVPELTPVRKLTVWLTNTVVSPSKDTRPVPLVMSSAKKHAGGLIHVNATAPVKLPVI